MMITWCSKHVGAWNKLTVKQKFYATSWLITKIKTLYNQYGWKVRSNRLYNINKQAHSPNTAGSVRTGRYALSLREIVSTCFKYWRGGGGGRGPAILTELSLFLRHIPSTWRNWRFSDYLRKVSRRTHTHTVWMALKSSELTKWLTSKQFFS